MCPEGMAGWQDDRADAKVRTGSATAWRCGGGITLIHVTPPSFGAVTLPHCPLSLVRGWWEYRSNKGLKRVRGQVPISPGPAIIFAA